MAVREEQMRSEALSIFDNLDRFSRSQVGFLNWYQRTFAGKGCWQEWIKEAFGELLESFRGTRLRIAQFNEAESEQKQSYQFEKREVLIGRGDDNDIPLGRPAVSRRHARIFAQGNAYLIEHLGSGTATYLNGRALKPAEPQPLADGDELLIFPYKLQAGVEEVWVREDGVQTAQGATKSSTTTQFGDEVPAGFSVFRVQIHPGCGDAFIAVNQDFLETLVSGMMREVVSELVVADLGLLEFVLVHVLERANRELRLPLQFSLHSPAAIATSEPGVAADFTVKTSSAVGSFKVFVPEKVLAGKRDLAKPESARKADRDIRWKIPVRVGHVDLTPSDLDELELGDILLYRSALELVLPAAGKERTKAERGWQATELSRDPYRLKLQKFFERSVLMENANGSQLETEDSLLETDDSSLEADDSSVEKSDSPSETDHSSVVKPDLGSLPVRVHVVLSHAELSFGELEALAEGSILELEHAKGDAVQLLANGKLIGTGELVEVEDKLGVRITKWSAS
jgi:type III secretion system YscQ/HrcQ family protein